MATIGTRIKDGQEEIIITNNNNEISSLYDLLITINKTILKFRLYEDRNKEQKIFITERVDLSKRDITKNIIISNCVFEKPVNFTETVFQSLELNNVEFKEDIDFSKAIFNNIVNLEKNTFNKETKFSNALFKKEVSFKEVIFEKEVFFKETCFQGMINFNNIVFKGAIFFNYTNFEQDVKFLNTTFVNTTKFNDVIFGNQAHFETSKFEKSVYFFKNTFNNCIRFDHLIFTDLVHFYDTLIQKEICFNKNNFKKIVNLQASDCKLTKFLNCKFENSISLSGSIFHNQINFSHSIFNTPQEFKNIHFMDRANFSNTTFEQEAMFTDCKVDSKTLISFQCATFKKGLDISTSNFNLCKLNFLGIRIENIDEALSSVFYDNKRENTKPFLSIHHRLRETFRFIKNSLYAENNQIEGLEFHKKEMEVYGKELEGKDDEYWEEKMILWFNKMSNNYGTSWLRGVGFTAVWALVILGIILGITTLENSGIIFNLCDLDAWKQIIKAYIEIINIAKWTDIKPLECKLSGFGLFFLFVGRIFIGYGYYQTIQAFRKYGK